MKRASGTSVLFLDIGGLILTNGWDRAMRRRAAETFGLEFDEMNERHNLTFDTYERGLLSLDEYLQRVVFHHERPFTPEQFKTFMFEPSQLLIDDRLLSVEVAQGLEIRSIYHEDLESTGNAPEEFGLTRPESRVLR